MKLSDLSENWPKVLALIVLTALLFLGHGCPSQVTSLRDPLKKVTRPELQIELSAIVSTAEFKMAQLDKQDQFRDLIFKNALIMVEGGGMNPLGIITLLTSLYGITRGGSDIVKKVKKRKETPT